MPTKWRYRWYRWLFSWSGYQSTLVWLHRRDELNRLKDWAKRKQLGVFHHYHRLSIDAELTLSRKSGRHPQVYKWARLTYQIQKLITPDPKYYPKGYAAKYRACAI